MARPPLDRDVMPASGAARWLRTIAIGMVTLLAAAVSVAVSYAAVIQKWAPDQALPIWPSGDVKAAIAAQALAEPGRKGSYARARKFAREALLQQPMSVRAASTLALVDGLQGRSQEAERLLSYAERLSRRDLPTQLALIEIRVQANDVAGALVHYDRALRTSTTSAPILLPVLVAAVDNPDIARALAPRLAARADWWKPFTLQMIQQDTSAPSSYTLLHALHLDIRRPDEHAMAEDAMQRMAGHGRVDLAARLYTELQAGRPAPSARVHDGAFRLTHGLAPFDWNLTDRTDLSATVETRPDGKGNGLILTATDGASGTVARALLLPAPGRYTLGFDIGDLSQTGTRIIASVRCNGSITPLASVRPAPAPGKNPNSAMRIVMPFTVPAACRGLWLEFVAQASEGMDTTAPWIGAVSVSPQAGSLR